MVEAVKVATSTNLHNLHNLQSQPFANSTMPEKRRNSSRLRLG